MRENKDFFDKYFPFALLGLFIIAALLYVNIDGLPLTHPGNLKAADPMYHTICTQSIIDTKQWNYYDTYISLGQQKATNSQPPLFYTNAAILSEFSGVPPWATLYFLVSIVMGFFVILIYLITNEIFENKIIALITGCLSVLPLPVYVWLYPLYIGFWIQVISNFFILLFAYLFIRYFKTNEKWTLIFISICYSSILLVHPQDLGVLIIPSIILGIKLIKNYLLDKNHKDFIKKISFTGLIPLLVLIPLLPRLFFVWGSAGNAQFQPGFFGIRSLYFTREYTNGLVFPDILFLFNPGISFFGLPELIVTLFLLIIFLSGMIQIFMNYKKYFFFISTFIYFFTVMYIFPIFFKDPYYFVRLRSISPFILYPVFAYALYYFGIRFIKNLHWKYFVVAFIIIGTFIVSFPQYIGLVKQMSYEHIPLDEWNAYKWIQENTPKESTILIFGSVFQAEYLYSKRITGVFGMEEMQRIVNEYISTNITPTSFKGGWGGDTLRMHKYEKSFWSYGEYSEPNNTLSLLDFDYIFFQDISQEIANVNHFFAGEFINKYNFVPVYNQEGYIIIKNENK